MTSLTTPVSTIDERVERAQIDVSCRRVVLFFYSSAVFWLLAATAFGLLSSFKMHSFFWEDYAWLTFGRIRSAHLSSVTYGWSSLAAIGTAIWLMARLCRITLRYPSILITGGILWNLGVVIGIIGILAGASTSIEWLEFPSYANLILFIGYTFIGVWVIVMFRFRQQGMIYISQYYLFAAFFWFPWLYGVTNITLLLRPVEGVVQALVNWWYGHNILGLWFTPIGLATIYYMIPKVIGRPIHSYYLSIFGFWSFALFYSWNGAHHLIDGPIPVWIQSASIVASVMMVIPVVATAINHHMTMKGYFDLLKSSPTLLFIVFGAMCYTAVSLQGSSMAIRGLYRITHFTNHTIGHAHLGLYSFFTMAMFGAMYYIVPRLVQWEWPSALLIKIHFWSVAIGSLIMFLILTIAGFREGVLMQNPKVPFMDIVEGTIPFLVGRSFSGVLILLGHLVFAISFILMLRRAGEPHSEPTLLSKTQANDISPKVS